MKCKLWTAADEFVHQCEIPPFNTAPAVLLWGTRVFILDHTTEDGIHDYIEAFTYAVPYAEH